MCEWRPQQGKKFHARFQWQPTKTISPAFASVLFLSRNAYAIALFLESHDAVSKVLYPGLPSHPQHEIAKRQQHGFGAMITFYCIGGRAQSAAILQGVSETTLLNRIWCRHQPLSRASCGPASRFCFSRVIGCCRVFGGMSVFNDTRISSR